LGDGGGNTHAITLARVYDAPSTAPARRFLVDRVWPRGVRRADLALEGWLKDAAPSAELRRWYGHEPARWEEFRRRYTTELDEHPETWRPLLEAARSGDVVLLYAAREREHNNAAVLRDQLMERLSAAATED
jgi:uncharacterized protein YeaO (DUF488 family)